MCVIVWRSLDRVDLCVCQIIISEINSDLFVPQKSIKRNEKRNVCVAGGRAELIV